MSITTSRMKGGMDKLKIEGKTFYAWGEYRLSAVGKGYAENYASKMREMGHKARIIKRKTGYQVYCNSPSGVLGK